MTAPPRRCIAASNDRRVRVEGSRNSVARIEPASVWDAGPRSSSAAWPSSDVIWAFDRSSIEIRSRFMEGGPRSWRRCFRGPGGSRGGAPEARARRHARGLDVAREERRGLAHDADPRTRTPRGCADRSTPKPRPCRADTDSPTPRRGWHAARRIREVGLRDDHDPRCSIQPPPRASPVLPDPMPGSINTTTISADSRARRARATPRRSTSRRRRGDPPNRRAGTGSRR